MAKNIAIVGTQGAGKTVLTTMLAKYLSTPRNGVVLIPESTEIAEYIELNFWKLQRGEWLDSTNDQKPLSWKLRIPGREDQPLTLLDCPGEDIQRLFAKRQFDNRKTGESKRDRELVDYLLSASKVLLLINLSDFLDESDDDVSVRKRLLKEHSLKEFLTAIRGIEAEKPSHSQGASPTRDLQMLDNEAVDSSPDSEKGSRDIAVLFTAYNQYRRQIASQYGSVGTFLSKKLPALWYEHFDGKGVTGIRVSAVVDTGEDGYPKRGFRSEGLDLVTEWLIDPIRYVEARTRRDQSDQGDQGTQSDRHDQAPGQKERSDNAGEARMFDW